MVVVNPSPAPQAVVAGDADFDIVARRIAHDVMDVGHVDYEIMSLGTVDMEEFEHDMDKEALTDDNWIWEEPELIYNPKQMDEHELILARDEEMESLVAFDALEWWNLADAKAVNGATWLGTRWEDTRKDTGEVRSRWVAQDFAFSKVDGEHFSGTRQQHQQQ